MVQQRTVSRPDGSALAYLEAGIGDRPILFVPGMSFASRDWLPVADLLAGRSWLAIDLPGHGRSTHQELYSLERDADAVVALLEHLGTPAVLVGHSRGGMVAGIVASRRPELVRGVCYEDVTPLWADNPIRPKHVVSRTVFGLQHLVIQQRAEGRTVEWLAEQIGHQRHDEKRLFRQVLPASALSSWADQLLEVDPDMFGPKIEPLRTALSPAEQLARYAGPVHVVHGEIDLGSIVLPSELELMRKHAARMSSTQLAGTGHFLHAQTPERFSQELRSFLHANDM